MKTIIHVNQHNIKANKDGNNRPVITCKTYKSNKYAHQVDIKDKDGEIVAKIIYSPDKPLSCGAKVWIETNNFVVAIFIAIQILTFLRIFASISSNFDLNYLLFIDVTSLLLVMFLIIWSSKYVVILVENEKKVEKSSKWKA